MKIPAITAFSENFRPLYDRWRATLPAGFDPIVKAIDIANDGYGFLTGSWYDAITKKIQHFIDTLASLPNGTICLCCDVDIMFIKNSGDLADYLQTKITKNDLDMIFMRENDSNRVNGGFYCVRNSERVRNALKQAMVFCEKRTQYADQDYFNGDEFKQSGVKWDYIDMRLMVWGMHVYDKNMALFHHAVCAGTLAEKMHQQQAVGSFFQLQLS